MRNPERRRLRAQGQMIEPSLHGSLRAATPVRDAPPPTTTRVVPEDGGQCSLAFGGTGEVASGTSATPTVSFDITTEGTAFVLVHISGAPNLASGRIEMRPTGDFVQGPTSPILVGFQGDPFDTDPEMARAGTLTYIAGVGPGTNVLGALVACNGSAFSGLWFQISITVGCFTDVDTRIIVT